MVMTVQKTLIRSSIAACGALLALALALPSSPAQGPSTFNEREVKATTSNDDPKSGVWTFDFRFKDPRLIKVNVPGRGTKICWYLWYQVINRTGEPRYFYPEFQLVTLDHPGVYVDEPLTTVEDAIKKELDPTGYQEIKNSVTISINPIPASLPPDKAFPKVITGVAIWDGTPADPKARDENKYDLSDSQRFSIFIGGLSNGSVQVDPLAKGKVETPIVRRRTLQLNFKRTGDRWQLDSRDISFEAPAEWIYRASVLPKAKDKDKDKDKAPPKVDAPAKDGKDAKAGALLAPLCDLPALIQPVLERGYEHGT